LGYLSNQAKSNEMRKIFLKSAQTSSESLDENENAILKQNLFNYYCVKIFNESTKLYNSYGYKENFSEDLFIEQGKLFSPIINFFYFSNELF
jgi:hypothetical protein